MKIQKRTTMALLIVTLAVAACGGASATSSSAAEGPASATAPTSAPASDAAGAPAAAAPGTPAPADSTAAIDACALITEQEATAFLGSDPGPGQETGTATAPSCAYGASLTFSIEPTDGKAQYDTTKSAMQGSAKAQDLTGVGDEGFVFIVANTIAQMAILKGSTLLTVNVQGDPSLQNITMASLSALGKTAVARL